MARTPNEIVRELEPPVRRFCVARTGPLWDPALSVEDVVQETLVAVARKIPALPPTPDARLAYAFGIAKNKITDAYRASGRRRDLVRSIGEDDPEQVDGAPGPEARVLEGAAAEWVESVLATLPPHQALVLRLRVLDERPAAEVAVLLGSSPGAVRVAQHRALTALRARLAPLIPPSR